MLVSTVQTYTVKQVGITLEYKIKLKNNKMLDKQNY